MSTPSLLTELDSEENVIMKSEDPETGGWSNQPIRNVKDPLEDMFIFNMESFRESWKKTINPYENSNWLFDTRENLYPASELMRILNKWSKVLKISLDVDPIKIDSHFR